MGTLYENIMALCSERGIKGGKMCTDIGMSKGILTDLKMGRQSGISTANAQKVASYFGVSVEYLLGQTSIREKPLATEDEELAEYLEMLRTRPEMRMLFRVSKDATKADVEKAVAIVEALRRTEG